MAAAVLVRGDYDAAQMRGLAKRSEDAAQTRRLLALAAIYDGGSRSEAAKIGGAGQRAAAHRRAPASVAQIVESGPIPAVHGVVRWRLIDLAQWVFEEFRISISKQTLSRELRALELRKLSARPRHHAQDAEVLAAFKKTSPRASTRL